MSNGARLALADKSGGSSQADTDLAEIWAYVAEENLGAADRLIARFTSAFVRLRSSPELGERFVRPRGEFRRFVVGNYVVIYQLVAEEIRVVRVLHGSRQWESLI